MSKKLLYLLGILLTILLGTWLYHRYCCHCDVQAPQTGIEGAYYPFALNGNGMDYKCDENFKFPLNDFNPVLPAGECIDKGIEQLKKQLEANPNQKVVITGYCNPDEKNGSLFPNLGIARANAIKNYFVSKGISASQIELKGDCGNKLKQDGNNLLGAVSFALTDAGAADAAPAVDYAALKEKLNANPLILYFESGQSEINLSAEERQKVLDVVNYLDHVKDAKVSVVGHTDNTGKKDVNQQLGLDRAEFAKQMLVKNGIAESAIIASSKGQTEPIADNATAEGKAKNRRAVVTIH